MKLVLRRRVGLWYGVRVLGLHPGPVASYHGVHTEPARGGGSS